MAVLASLLVTAPRVEAATRTWDGGGADSNWSTAANWSLDTLPVAGDTVTFNGTSTKDATIDVPVTVAVFQVNAGYTGTITQNSTLTLTSSFTQSAGTFVGGGAAVSVTGGTIVNSGGVFNGGTSSITLNGALTVNAGGAFTSTSSSLTVTGAVTLAAGVFTHNAGSVVFSTSNATLNLGGAATFNNVQFLSGTKTISAANTLTVLGTLTMTAGAVNTGTIAAQGDISVASGFTGGSATLLINGGGAQAWTDALSATADLPVVNINKPSGTLTMTGTFRTTHNWTYSAAGGLVTAGSTLVFAGTQTISGSHTLDNVEIRGGTITIAAGTTLTASGALNLFSGTLNTGTLAAQGSIDAQIGYTGGGTATLLINGSAAQTFTGFHTTAAGSLPNLDINKPSGTLTLAGTIRTARNWTWTAGTLSAAGSTVIFNGTQAVSGSQTLANVEVRGGALTIAAGTTLTVTGGLNLFSGSLSTGVLAPQGDIDARIGFTGGGTATLLINGTGSQTFTGFHTTAAGSLPNLDINKPSGTLTITGTLRTARNWTYTAGTLSTAGSTVIFNGTQAITGSHTLDAVEIRGAITLASGTTLTATGSVNLFSGTLNTGTLAAQGGIDVQIGYTGTNTATLLINGTGSQTLTGFHTTATGTLPNLDINKPSGTLTIAGTIRTARNWTWTAGTVSTAGSTLVFAGTQTISGSHTLDNVEIRGGTITIAAGTTLTASGALNLFSGTLNTGTLAAQGSIDVQIGYTGTNTATLLINGTGSQTLTGFHTTATGTLPNLDINKPSGTLTIAGTFRTTRNWTWTAGTLSAGSSTVIFAGTQTITGSHTLDNVELRGGTITIGAGTTLTVTGALNLFSGSLSTGVLAAQGDIDAQIGFTGGGTATLLINGSAAQTFTGFHTTAAGSLPNLDINKPSGTLTITGTLRTARNWTWTAGTLSTAGSTVIFNGTLTITGDHTLGNVELHAGDVTVAPADTLTVNGLLTLTNGNLNGGTILARADIALLGTYDGETGTLLVAGAGDQTWTGSANTTNSDLPNVVIDKPSGTLFLVGTIRATTESWTWLSGALDPGTSTVYFDAGVAINGTHTLYNVYLSGGAHTVGIGDTLTVDGALTLDNGTIDGGTIAAAGSVDQLSTFDGGTGLLTFTGAANRAFTGAATTVAGDLPAVEIAATGGTLTLAGTVRTRHDWSHTSGAVDPDSSLVVFAGTLTVDAAIMPFNDVLVNAGTSTLAANLTVLNDLTVAAGTLAIGPNTVFVAGDVTVGGAITATTGELNLDGVSGQLLAGSAPIALYDLTISDPAGVTQTTSVAVAGTLHLGGPLDFSGQSLTIAHAITGTPTDLTADGTSTLVVNGAGTGVVVPSSLTTLLNLGISNPSGASLAGSLTVNGLVTLGGGNLDAGGGVLSIGPAGLLSRTSGHVIGALQKWILTGSGVTQAYEIGDATTFAPLALTFGTVGISGQVTASTTAGEHAAIATSPIYAPRDVNRWWALANSGVAFDTLAVGFTFAPADVDPGAVTSRFIVAKWDGGWTTPTSGGNTATSITASGITSFSEFAVGEPAAAVPTPTPTPTPTPLPTSIARLADTSATDWGRDVSPLMLLGVFGAWMALLGALAAEHAWSRRSRL